MKAKISYLTPLALITVAVPAGIAAMPVSDGWQIGPTIRGHNYSVGMPADPNVSPEGNVSFQFPQRGSEVDAMTKPVRPLADAKSITLRYRIDASPRTKFVSVETPEKTATVSLYFQQNGDNWTARGRYGSYRWYVPTRAVVPLVPGEHTITVRFDEVWTNVNGQPNTIDPRGFANALNDTDKIGIAFGTSSARSHGVYSTGPARFTLLSLDVN